MLRSIVCRYEHFLTDWHAKWCNIIGFSPDVSRDNKASYRKIWEYTAICQALEERDMLRPGRRGIGFAVGAEPLASIFAARGCKIVASDLPSEGADNRWTSTGQHASNLSALFHPNHVSEDDFRQRVTFQPIDMRSIDHLPQSAFDFMWSSCAIEHIGSIALGAEFVKRSMQVLKPGGIAVHTTEFNCSSNDETIFEGENVIFRQQDIERLDRDLRLQRCGIEATDFFAGVHGFDLDFDEPPYFESESVHIKLAIGGHVSTSFLIIAHKR